MRNRHYSVTGMGAQNFNDLEDYSTLDISGMGAVTISGSIGQHVTINKSGMGVLNVNGTVDPTAKFEISGMGAVNFLSRPPQAVLDNLEFSGMGTINVPGGYQAKSPSYSEPSYSYSSPGAVTVHGSGMKNVIIDGSGIRYTDASGKNVGNVVGRIGGTNVIRNLVMDSNGTRYIDGHGKQVVLPPGHGPISLGGMTIGGNVTTMQFGASSDDSDSSSDESSSDSDKYHVPAYPSSTRKTTPAHSNTTAANNNLSEATQAYLTRLKNQTSHWNAPSAAAAAAPSQNNAVNNLLHELSPTMQTYKKSFENKSRNSVLYNSLTEEEKKSFEQFGDFFDCKTFELIDIPVAVNGNFYNLQTLLDQPANAEGQREELQTRLLFYPRDIQPARHIANAIQSELEKFGKVKTMEAPKAAALPGTPPALFSSAPNAVTFRQVGQVNPQTEDPEIGQQNNCMTM